MAWTSRRVSFALGLVTSITLLRLYRTSSRPLKEPYEPPPLLPGAEGEESFRPFANAKDVRTPYGVLRTYRLGSADADRKVLLLHGISTPSIAFKALATSLASKGAYVLCFDLPCRGSSGGPSDLPYDGRLYASMILMVLASDNEADWRNFTIIGYSLGGGLAMDFTYWFPSLVEDLVLIAPSGLVRQSHVTWWSWLVYRSGLVRGSLRKRLIGQRLRMAETKTLENERRRVHSSLKPEGTAVDSEVPEAPSSIEHTTTSHVARAVNYQIDHHSGFVDAFVSTLLHAPIHRQHERWKAIGERLDKRVAKDQSNNAEALTSMPPNKLSTQ